MLLLDLWVSVDRVSMMCADLMMRRARLFGPLLASGCEVLISGKGTRRVRLFDGERALVGNATAKRRREFTETRLLAHEALRRIGHDGPILKGVFCQVVIGQCGVSFPSEKAVGFSPVRNWPVIARVLLFHCIRA